MNPDGLKDSLLAAGASVVGFGDVSVAVAGGEISHLDRAVCIGVNRNLNESTVEALKALQREAAAWLKERGFRQLSIPPDSDRQKGKFISHLYPLFCHKTAATCAGLGWIGKNGLVINPVHGPKMSWTTVLTDAPLDTDEPMTSERCGSCSLCVEHCPSGALTGGRWDTGNPYVLLIDLEKCRTQKKNSRRVREKPNCGLYINICPYGRKKILSGGDRDEEIQSDIPTVRQQG